MAKREEDIMRASVKIFAEKGYQDTHIADIVEEVGIAKGTFYLYFKSKKDVFLSLIDSHTNSIREDINISFLNSLEGEDLKEIIKGFLRGFFLSYFKNKNLTSIIFREAIALDSDFEEKMQNLHQIKIDIMSELHEFLLNGNYGVREQKFEVFSHMILGIIESYILKSLMIYKDNIDLEEIIEGASDYIYRAIKE